ncbi:MAG TPA: hypothetical protein VN918_08205, partial [Myxococcaceae bacterium]|nr:hypothetical protein [Myxococcaceae bacterium]
LTTFPLPSPWVIRFGEPIDSSPSGDPLPSSAAVERKVARVRASIEAMIDALRRERPGGLRRGPVPSA